MKKLIVILCIAIVASFLGGFLTGHFTQANSNNENVVSETEHNAQVQSLIRQIEDKQGRIYDLWERADFYNRVIFELLRMFDTQHEMIEDALGLMLHYRDLLNKVNLEIQELQSEIIILQDLLNQYRESQKTGIPIQWNGVWGQYWQDCCCNGGEYVFEKIVAVENGVFTFAEDMETEVNAKVVGNTLIMTFNDSDHKFAYVFAYCVFSDVFFLTNWIVLFTAEYYDEYKDLFGDFEKQSFFDTDYYFFSIFNITSNGTIVIERQGGAV